MSIDHSGKGYTPLPQSISNTDTEDEDEHLSHPNNIIGTKSDDTTITTSISLQKNGVYYPLDETRNLANRAKNGQSILRHYQDDVPIIKGSPQNDLWKPRDMSPIRRFCLILSILLCVTTILVFLYVLPCDDSMVCPPVTKQKSSISWDKTLQGVELYGPISIIPDSPYNLIFLLRGQRYSVDNTSTGDTYSEGNGVISMQGSTGLPLWKWLSSKRVPADIDCISLDTDRSGKPDCIVVGDQGLLVSLDPTAGTAHWSSTLHTAPQLPVILPDIDYDGVEDLLSVELPERPSPSVVILSGGSGQLLGQYTFSTDCFSIDIYSLVTDGNVTYLCRDANGKDVKKYVSLNSLLDAVRATPTTRKLVTQITNSPRVFETTKPSYEELNWPPTPYHRLSVENFRNCPGESCRAVVNLTMQKNSNETLTIWDHVSPDSIVSKPAFLVTREKFGKPRSVGFAIKFWQSVNSTSKDTEAKPEIVQKRLIERVLIFANYTNIQVINASQSDVIQLCHGADCQPNLDLRVRFSSLAIAYIGQDGPPELISYWSSYDTDTSRALTSKVQVIKLDSIVLNPSQPST